ncbi:hypothetical protein LTR50_003926 [Elasticomyces elasticus]|nr:hypothetical protein LTR50_003926 [Elasticomyces elasticus]
MPFKMHKGTASQAKPAWFARVVKPLQDRLAPGHRCETAVPAAGAEGGASGDERRHRWGWLGLFGRIRGRCRKFVRGRMGRGEGGAVVVAAVVSVDGGEMAPEVGRRSQAVDIPGSLYAAEAAYYYDDEEEDDEEEEEEYGDAEEELVWYEDEDEEDDDEDEFYDEDEEEEGMAMPQTYVAAGFGFSRYGNNNNNKYNNTVTAITFNENGNGNNNNYNYNPETGKVDPLTTIINGLGELVTMPSRLVISVPHVADEDMPWDPKNKSYSVW